MLAWALINDLDSFLPRLITFAVQGFVGKCWVDISLAHKEPLLLKDCLQCLQEIVQIKTTIGPLPREWTRNEGCGDVASMYCTHALMFLLCNSNYGA
jgi:hypothetical protein